ncbi:MAG: aldehyde dehydrogenase [Thermoanaerobaculia bacterium]|nr:aldehyde dehydrogenase [Thermoanaerobaculia bacterium]
MPNALPQLPVLRLGKPYFSLERRTLTDVRTGAPVAEMSQAIPGLVSRDLGRAAERRRILDAIPVAQLIEICHRAGELFGTGELPLFPGSDVRFGPDDYLQHLTATTGMPLALGRANLDKIVHVMTGIEGVLDGLTRGLDLSVLDGGWGEQHGRKLSYQRLTDDLGAILPNNSPGVHNLWIPAFPLKVPLVLRPGSSEPWSPYRIVSAFLEAGAPPEAFSLYPGAHSLVPPILVGTGRSMFFGDASTVAGWRGTGKVQVHGPGWSKVILGPDVASDNWRQHVPMLADSVARNGGRSCINCSGVWAASDGQTASARAIGEAMARELLSLEARALDHPEAGLAAFPDPEVARAISDLVDSHLATPGAVDLSMEARIAAGKSPSRVAEAGGCTFLLPTVIHAEDPDHPLVACEFIFPFVTVVDCPTEVLFEQIGETLIGSVVSDDEEFLRRALDCRHIDRLNLGAMATYRISWDQPHEGNLFDHLYQQRAFQLAS